MQTEVEMRVSDDEEEYVAEDTSFTCEECGRTYERPIFAHIISGGQTQKYYACPRCMTKVPQTAKIVQETKPATANPPAKRAVPAQKAVVAGCAYHFGYLRKREKDKPIPEECLTCGKMIECVMQ